MCVVRVCREAEGHWSCSDSRLLFSFESPQALALRQGLGQWHPSPVKQNHFPCWIATLACPVATLARDAPRRYGWPPAGGLALSSTKWMVHRVHRDPAYCRPNAAVPARPRLAKLFHKVQRVGHLPNCSHGHNWDHAPLFRGHPEHRKAIFCPRLIDCA